MNNSYYISRDKSKKTTTCFEINKLDGYKITPKTSKEEILSVSKIIFIKPELSEKIIRKKIDKKINYLLKQLKDIEENGDNDEGSIKKSLMDCEKLRMQIINNYVKYLGHTYESLTLKKIEIIINELRYKLFTVMKKREQLNYYEEEKQSHRGR